MIYFSDNFFNYSNDYYYIIYSDDEENNYGLDYDSTYYDDNN